MLAKSGDKGLCELGGFYKRECQEKVFPQRRGGESVLDIQPLSPGSRLLAALVWDKQGCEVAVHVALRRTASPFENANKQNAGSVCQPWFYLRLWPQARPYSFVGLSEGHRVARETWFKPIPALILTLEP